MVSTLNFFWRLLDLGFHEFRRVFGFSGFAGILLRAMDRPPQEIKEISLSSKMFRKILKNFVNKTS